MTTLADLRTRVITETNRDDLADDLSASLDLCIAQSIDYWKNSRFWFNELRTTSTITAGSEYVDWPVGAVWLDQLRIIIGGVRYSMTKNSMEEIEDLYSVPLTGQPTNWAEFNGQARVWPTPGINYTLIWLGIKEVTPALDFEDPNSTNDWLAYGYDLIDARTRFLLYRDYFRDEGGMQIAKAAETEAYANLKAISNRRLATGRVQSHW